MKKWITFLFLVASFNALAGFTDGNSLIKALEGKKINDLGYRSGYFDGYVTGVSDLSINFLWCPPPGVSGGQLPKIVANYLEAHPERLHEGAGTLVVEAIKIPFPCKE